MPRSTLLPAAVILCLLASLSPGLPVVAETPKPEHLKSSLHLHIPFDRTFDARVSAADGRVYTADSSERKSVQEGNQIRTVGIVTAAGRFGDAVRFSDKSQQVLFYQGSCMHYSETEWSGTVSFWMKLDPDQDLKPGYCDPIQITQKGWNDAAFFVDFDRELPRDFRLGVFADYKFWNPADTLWEKLPVTERPMVVVKEPPFSRDEWTHVAFTFENINASDSTNAVCTLYLNGQNSGSMSRPLQFHWDQSSTAIMLGLAYIGDLDDLTVFRRALTAPEMKLLYELPGGASDL